MLPVRRGILGCGLLLAACSGRSGAEILSGPDACCADASPIEAGDASPDTTAPADAAPDAPDAGCVDACNAAQSVGCASDDLSDCVLACDDFASQFPKCLGEIAAVDTCTAQAPATAWSCDGDGFAKLSACQSELAARQACFAGNP